MSETATSSRLEAFCDGVFAIAITLLIIDVKIPSSEKIESNADFVRALKHVAPSVFAFLLSFIIILITWVNHHNAMKLGNKVSSLFIYANGYLLLTVVFMPFPSSLVGEHILTDHAAPAVILYDATMALQALGWVLITQAALKDHLGKSEKATLQIRRNGQFGYFAFALYSLFAILAIWLPLFVAAVTTITWIFWLVWGIRLKHTNN
jgi:uncharacterized membrane protein